MRQVGGGAAGQVQMGRRGVARAILPVIRRLKAQAMDRPGEIRCQHAAEDRLERDDVEHGHGDGRAQGRPSS